MMKSEKYGRIVGEMRGAIYYSSVYFFVMLTHLDIIGLCAKVVFYETYAEPMCVQRIQPLYNVRYTVIN